ncbi:MAG: IS110 family transposase [Microbacteriaceae bacterium]|nr:MAG: IS110 family transposase [Microbacteriaceae bacterium]
MDVVHERAVGIDISKRDAKVCVRVPGKKAGTFTSTVTTWGSTTAQILKLREFLVQQQVTVVVLESTSDYWKPFYYVMEDSLPVLLVNAKNARNIPGRKTDVSDCAWLAQLGAYGLLRASFVPPEPIRQLRDLTRARTIATQDRTREVQRLEKFLESSGIKLSAVATQLTGASSRAMLEALVGGERDPQVLAGLAKGRLKAKNAELVQALAGRFGDHDAFMTRSHLEQIDTLTDRIDQFTARIEEAMAPFRHIRQALMTIPGASGTVAEVILAEIGADMSVFATAAHLASWAGVSPGSNQSAGRVKSTRTMPGNKRLKGALGIAALAASRSKKNTYLAVKYRRIAARRGRIKALVAIEHTILIAVWNMLTTGEDFTDLGVDYYLRQDPEKATKRAIRQLRTLGYEVAITPAAA